MAEAQLRNLELERELEHAHSLGRTLADKTSSDLHSSEVCDVNAHYCSRRSPHFIPQIAELRRKLATSESALVAIRQEHSSCDHRISQLTDRAAETQSELTSVHDQVSRINGHNWTVLDFCARQIDAMEKQLIASKTLSDTLKSEKSNLDAKLGATVGEVGIRPLAICLSFDQQCLFSCLLCRNASRPRGPLLLHPTSPEPTSKAGS